MSEVIKLGDLSRWQRLKLVDGYGQVDFLPSIRPRRCRLDVFSSHPVTVKFTFGPDLGATLDVPLGELAGSSVMTLDVTVAGYAFVSFELLDTDASVIVRRYDEMTVLEGDRLESVTSYDPARMVVSDIERIDTQIRSALVRYEGQIRAQYEAKMREMRENQEGSASYGKASVDEDAEKAPDEAQEPPQGGAPSPEVTDG